jgi:threonine/homoserine/homoserine lactone efflux protein
LISTVLAASILGIFAGLVPGPYTTMVVGTAIERGFRSAVVLAFTPLVTDIPPMIVTALILESLSWTALTVLGLVGGVVLAWIGVRFLRRHGAPLSRGSRPEDQSAHFWHAAGSSLISPAPWLFWLVVASPLLLRSWSRGTGEGVVFIAVFFVVNIGSAASLAWVVSHSRNFLAPSWQRRVLQAVGTGLILAGAGLVWQSVEGNFQSLIERQDTFREVLEEQTSLGAPDADRPPASGAPGRGAAA